jgi:hypothetical protein
MGFLLVGPPRDEIKRERLRPRKLMYDSGEPFAERLRKLEQDPCRLGLRPRQDLKPKLVWVNPRAPRVRLRPKPWGYDGGDACV